MGTRGARAAGLVPVYTELVALGVGERGESRMLGEDGPAEGDQPGYEAPRTLPSTSGNVGGAWCDEGYGDVHSGSAWAVLADG